MSEGTKELNEFIDAIELVINTGVAIGADKKINGADFSKVVSLLGQVDKVVDGVKGLKSLPAEVKDLDQAELLAIGTRLYELVKSVKHTYEANKAG